MLSLCRWRCCCATSRLATDCCVKFTALDAVREGFAVFLIEDGCRGIDLDPGDVDRALDRMRLRGVVALDSGSIGP